VLEREAVTGEAARLIEQASADRGGAFFISAEPGLGKTSCLRAISSLAGATVLQGSATGDALETSLPFGLMSQAVGALGGPHPGVAEGHQSPMDARAAYFFGVLDWLEALGTRPVLFCLDDLHWADPDSLALVSFLARRISGLAVAMVGTLRPWPSQAEEVVRGLVDGAYAKVARLSPLTREASAQLLADLVGRPLSSRVASGAFEACAGNPLLLEQLAALVERGDELADLTEWQGRHVGDELLLARFAGLGRAGLGFAQAACVLGARFDAGLAGEMAGLAEEEGVSALDALARSGLVRSVDDRSFEFVHPLFRQALYQDMSSPTRGWLHTRAFRLLHARRLDAEAGEHAKRAGLAGDDEAVGALYASGLAALRSGALVTAADHLRAAVELAGPRVTTDLLMAESQAFLARGDLELAGAALERILSTDDLEPGLRIQALRTAGRAHYATGRAEAARACYEQAVRVGEQTDRVAVAEVLLDHALTCWLTAGPALGLPLATRARALVGELGTTAPVELARRADAAWGFAAMMAGDPSGFDAAARAAQPLLDSPRAHVDDLVLGLASTLHTYITCAALIERLPEALRVTEDLLAAAEQLEVVQTTATLSVVRGYLLYRLARLPEALESVDRAQTWAEALPMSEPYTAVGHAHILLHLGKVDEAEKWCVATEGVARARGDRVGVLFLCDVRGQRLLREGDPSEASRLYLEAEEVTRELGINEPCWVPWARHAVAAHVGSGRLEQARQVVSWLDACSQRLPCHFPRIAACCGRAWLEEAAGRRDDADALFRSALSLHQDTPLPLEKVETLLDYGAFLRRAGQPVRARSLLAEAVDLAGELSAGWLHDLAAKELAVAGGRRRRPHSQGLTAQEARVARLAGGGQSAAQLAAALSVSVNTVETHLRHIYAKLGVRSRAELVARLAAEPDLAESPKDHGD
jgi:DNA-binding CsgD family transcriptional regulator